MHPFSTLCAPLAKGADAIVCTQAQVPVMLCFADCVPVILTCPGGFAVVHSGWRGAYARIAASAARVLSQVACVPIEQVHAYIGPHILGEEYEVSSDLLHTFALQFDNIKESASRKLDLARAIEQSLVEVGVPLCGIHDTRLSTMSLNERFTRIAKSGECAAVMLPWLLCGKPTFLFGMRSRGLMLPLTGCQTSSSSSKQITVAGSTTCLPIAESPPRVTRMRPVSRCW